MKILYLVRGPFGTGKTEFARTMTNNVVSSWDYYMKYGENKWNPQLKPYADKHCFTQTQELMANETEIVAVTSSFSSNSDLDCYYELAETYGYKVFCLIMDNRDILEYKKDVPDEIISDQAKRLKNSIGFYNLVTGAPLE